MPKEQSIKTQRHLAFKIVLTESLNERLVEIASRLRCRKSEIIRNLLVEGLKTTYRDV